MNAQRFDALSRGLSASGSRRRILAITLSGPLAGLLGLEQTDAHNPLKKCKKKSGKQKKTCLKKAKKHNATHTTQTPSGSTGCTPMCGGKICGSDGCGGSCGACFGDCGGDNCSCPTGRLVRFSPHGQWGSEGHGNGQFDGPWGIAAAPNGTVYVADRFNNRIQRFDAQGNFLGKWGSKGTGNGQFDVPSEVAVALDGTVYVADNGNHRIQYFDAVGNFLGKWGSLGFPVQGDGQFNNPQGIAVAPNGDVYVADTNNGRIQRFDAVGTFEDKWSIEQAEDGFLFWGSPMGIAVAPDETVYVADSRYHRVLLFDAEGNLLGQWGTSYPNPGSGNGEFNEPSGIDVDSEGRVFVADTRNHRIQHFDAVGTFLGKWGSEGSFDGEFEFPRGVATHPSCAVYVADTTNDRIQVRRPVI